MVVVRSGALVRQIDEMLWPKQPFEVTRYEGRWVFSAPEYVDYRLTPELTNLLHQQSPLSSLQVVPPNPAQS